MRPFGGRLMLETQERDAKHSRIDLRTAITGIGVPIVVALIATRLDLYRGALLVGLAIVAVIVGAVPHLFRRFRNWWDRRADDKTARQVAPQLRTLYERFGDFTRSDRSNNLHWVVANLRSPNGISMSVKLADQHIFYSWWHVLNRRVQANRKQSMQELLWSIEDLSALISAYKRESFDPLFDRAGPDVLARLDGRACAELTLVREAFNDYLSRVEELTELVAAKIRVGGQPRFYVERPKPLQLIVGTAVSPVTK
jgi:hypothetical protein